MPEKRLNLSYLAPRFSQGVNYNIFTGILEGVKEIKANLISFTGSSFGDLYENDRQANMIFDLVTPNLTDGIICWTSSLIKFNDYVFDLESLIRRNSKIPIVCIGRPFQDLPTIEVDNSNGICNLMDHLVDVHGYRKIAFIRGPDTHNYAQNRYGAYVASLKKHGIPFDEKLVTPCGGFDSITGIQGVRHFFSEMKLRPKYDIEAIVTPSDIISVSATKELLLMGIKIPKQVAIVGFNNKSGSIELTPQLTTIDPQFSELGKKVVMIIHSMINGSGDPPLMTTIPSKMIIRESCGCLNQSYVTEKTTALNSIRLNDPTGPARSAHDCTNHREAIIASLSSALAKINAPEVDRKKLEMLFKSFCEQLEDFESNSFIEQMNEVIKDGPIYGENIELWQYFITKLRTLVLPYMHDDKTIFRADSIFHNSRVLLFQKLEQIRAIDNRKYVRLSEVFPVITTATVSTFDISTMIKNLKKELPKLGIKATYLALYDDPLQPEINVRLINVNDEEESIETHDLERVYPAHELIPKGILPNYNSFHLLIKSLFFQNTPLGFILFDIGQEIVDASVYTIISSNISSALQGAELLKRIEERARELEKMNQSLQENQQKLLIAEKMASLGKFTAGVAHEMNTPLATVRSALKELTELVSEYRVSVGNATIANEDHQGIASDMEKHIELATKSVEKCVSFIKGIKSQTYDMTKKKIRIFNVANIIEDNLFLLEYSFNKYNCKLFKDLDEEIMLEGDPHSFVQILTNLVINAIDACKPQGGTVSVSIKRAGEDKVRLVIADTGCGIPDENLRKIFDPLFTTKPFGQGSGLGLSIVHELINEFGGDIHVSSKPGKTSFTVTIPERKEENSDGKN